MIERSNADGLLLMLEQRFGGEVASSQGWNSQVWEAQDFLHAFGSPQSALLSAVLFVPEFIEIEGAIFLKGFGLGSRDREEVAKGVRNARETSSEALKAYVRSFNWIEIPYAFVDCSGTSDEYDKLTVLVAEAWLGRLRYLYPTRRFDVRILSPDETGDVVGVGIEEEL